MRILFFDTETSGLPKNWNAPVEQIENWPRLVQIAWQIYDLQGKLIESQQIKQTQFTKLGAKYPASIYQVVVIQDKERKVLRLIKK
jgi:hypothetical protein